jgi:hypothetical protein
VDKAFACKVNDIWNVCSLFGMNKREDKTSSVRGVKSSMTVKLGLRII